MDNITALKDYSHWKLFGDKNYFKLYQIYAKLLDDLESYFNYVKKQFIIDECDTEQLLYYSGLTKTPNYRIYGYSEEVQRKTVKADWSLINRPLTYDNVLNFLNSCGYDNRQISTIDKNFFKRLDYGYQFTKLDWLYSDSWTVNKHLWNEIPNYFEIKCNASENYGLIFGLMRFAPIGFKFEVNSNRNTKEFYKNKTKSFIENFTKKQVEIGL